MLSQKSKGAIPSCPLCDAPCSSSAHNFFRHFNIMHIKNSSLSRIFVQKSFVDFANSTKYKQCGKCGEFCASAHADCVPKKSITRIEEIDPRPLITATLENVKFVIESNILSKGFVPSDLSRSSLSTEKENSFPNISSLSSVALSSSPPVPPPRPDPIPTRNEYIKTQKFIFSRKFDPKLFLEIEKIQTTDEIPLQAQDLIAKCFERAVMRALENPADANSYIPLLLLPSLILVKDNLTGTKKASRKLSRLIRRGITFLEGDLDKLFEEAKVIVEKKSHKEKPRKKTEQRKRTVDLVTHGRIKTVFREWRGEEKVVVDEIGKKILNSKFPDGPELNFDEDLLDDSKFEPIQFTSDEIMKAVTSMRRRSGGIDHLSGELMVTILRVSSGALGEFTKLVNLFAAGKIPRDLVDLLPFRGMALRKGPRDLRPIQVPPFTEGTLTKAAMTKKREEVQKLIAEICPTQTALAPRGAEIAALATRDYVRRWMFPGSGKAMLQVDLSNCFNRLWRSFCFLFKLHLGWIYRYVSRIYEKSKYTVYDGHLIKVTIGLIQGCGMGPLACVLALAKLITDAFNKLLEKDPTAFSVSLMDDMNFCANESDVVETAKYIAEIGPDSCGAYLNPPKTVIYVLDSDLKIPEKTLDHVKRIVAVQKNGIDVGSRREDDGTRLLGSPVGSDEFCLKYFQDRFRTIYEPMMEKIAALNHPAAAWRLWQRLSVDGGMIHVFRSTPPNLLEKAFPDIEKKTRIFLSTAIFGRSLTDLQWKICQLPFSLGGWNFVPFQVLAPCAYLSSLLANREAVLKLRPDAKDRYEKEIQEIAELILKNDPSAKLPEFSSIPKQKDLVRAVMESRLNTLLETVSPRTKALIIGQRQPHSSLWKTADHTAELFMAPEIFQTAALFSVGAELMPEELCPVCKKVYLDPYGDHPLICMKEGGVVHRHNDAYRVFVTEARRGFIPLSVETKIQVTSDETYTADILLPYGIPGYSSRPTALDLTITTNFNATMVKKAAKTYLAAALSGKTRKENEHEKDLDALGIDFFPLAFESTGGHSPDVAPIAHYFIAQNALMTGIPFAELSTNFWQRLSVSIQKSNATAIYWRRKRLNDEKDE